MLNRDLVIGSQLLQCPEVCASCSEAKVAQTFRHAAGLLDRESDLLLAVTGAPVAHTRTLVRAPDGKDVLLARNLGSWGARNRTRTWRTKTSRAAVTPLPSALDGAADDVSRWDVQRVLCRRAQPARQTANTDRATGWTAKFAASCGKADSSRMSHDRYICKPDPPW